MDATRGNIFRDYLRIGRAILLTCSLAAFLSTLVAALNFGLSTAEPTHRMRYHAIPVAMSYLYHGRKHDYAAYWQIAIPFQDTVSSTQTRIDHALTQVVPAADKTYYWTADDRGLADYVIAAFFIFGPHVTSLFWLWFAILGASLISAALAFRRDPIALAVITTTMIAIGATIPIYTRASHADLAIHISESRMFDVLGAITFVHLLLLCLRPQHASWPERLLALVVPVAMMGFLLHTRSTLIWMMLVVMVIAVSTAVIRWRRGHVAGAGHALAPAALLVVAWMTAMGIQHAEANRAYRTQIGPRTVWHNILMGFHVSPAFAQALQFPGLDDGVAVAAVLRDMKERDDPRLGPDWTRDNILNSLGSHSRFDWVTYEAAARRLVFATLASDPRAALLLFLRDKPLAVLTTLNCTTLRLLPGCPARPNWRSYFVPSVRSGSIVAFWLGLAAVAGIGLGMACRRADRSAAAVLPVVGAIGLAALGSMLLAYLFYAASYQFGGTGVFFAFAVYFSVVLLVAPKWVVSE